MANNLDLWAQLGQAVKQKQQGFTPLPPGGLPQSGQFNAMGGFGLSPQMMAELLGGQSATQAPHQDPRAALLLQKNGLPPGRMERMPHLPGSDGPPSIADALMSRAETTSIPKMPGPGPGVGRFVPDMSYNPTPQMLQATMDVGGRSFIPKMPLNQSGAVGDFANEMNAWAKPPTAPPAELPLAAMLRGGEMARGHAAAATGLPMDTGRLVEGKQKMRQAMLDEEKGITSRLLANEQGTHFGGAVPVTGPNGKVVFVDPKYMKPIADQVAASDDLRARSDAAKAKLIERSGGFLTPSGAYTPSGGAPSRDLRSQESRDLMAAAQGRATERKEAKAARLSAGRALKSERMRRAAAATQQMLLAMSPQGQKIMPQLMQEQGLNYRAGLQAQMQNRAMQQEGQQFKSQQEVAQETLAVQKAYNEGRLTNDQAQTEIARLQAENAGAQGKQEMGLATDPRVVAQRAAEAAAAAGGSYMDTYRDAYKAASAGQSLAGGGQPSPAPGPAAAGPPGQVKTPTIEDLLQGGGGDLAGHRRSLESAGMLSPIESLASDYGGPNITDWKNPVAQGFGMALGPWAPMFGGTSPKANRRAGRIAQEIAGMIQQGRLSGGQIPAAGAVLRSQAAPGFMNWVLSQNTPEANFLRDLVSGKDLSAHNLTAITSLGY